VLFDVNVDTEGGEDGIVGGGCFGKVEDALVAAAAAGAIAKKLFSSRT